MVQFGVHAGLSRRRSRVQIPSGPPTPRSRDLGRVAQLAERPPEKRKVTGSTPVPTTTQRGHRSCLSSRRAASPASDVARSPVTWTRWLVGVAILAITIVPLAIGARAVCARLVPGWPRLPRALADVVVTVSAILLVAQALGTLHLLRPIVLVVVVPGGRVPAHRVSGPGAAPTPPSEPPVSPGFTVRDHARPGGSRRVAAEALGSVAEMFNRGVYETDALQYHMTFAAEFAKVGFDDRHRLRRPRGHALPPGERRAPPRPRLRRVPGRAAVAGAQPGRVGDRPRGGGRPRCGGRACRQRGDGDGRRALAPDALAVTRRGRCSTTCSASRS